MNKFMEGAKYGAICVRADDASCLIALAVRVLHEAAKESKDLTNEEGLA